MSTSELPLDSAKFDTLIPQESPPVDVLAIGTSPPKTLTPGPMPEIAIPWAEADPLPPVTGDDTRLVEVPIEMFANSDLTKMPLPAVLTIFPPLPTRTVTDLFGSGLATRASPDALVRTSES